VVNQLEGLGLHRLKIPLPKIVVLGWLTSSLYAQILTGR
jgi:hypothetical protein